MKLINFIKKKKLFLFATFLFLVFPGTAHSQIEPEKIQNPNEVLMKTLDTTTNILGGFALILFVAFIILFLVYKKIKWLKNLFLIATALFLFALILKIILQLEIL